MKKRMILPVFALMLGIAAAFGQPLSQLAFYLDDNGNGVQGAITNPANKTCSVQTGTQCYINVDGIDRPAHDTAADAVNNSGLMKWH
jgi:Family of unknown function (DUF6520)